MREFLLDPKRDPEQEYTIHLFEFCNLRCAFCWQNHEDTIGTDNVLDKLPSVEKFISKELMMKVGDHQYQALLGDRSPPLDYRN